MPDENELKQEQQEQQETHTAREIELEKKVAELTGRVEELTRQNQEIFVRFAGGSQPEEKDPEKEIRSQIRESYISRHRPAKDYFTAAMKGAIVE